MALEDLSTDELKELASYGGGFVLNARNRTTPELKEIASFGKSKQVRVVFKGITDRPLGELKEIASYGGGCVSFET